MIAAEEYLEALKPLGVILAEVPDHPEALYLMGYCHFHLDDDLQALRALAPLRGLRLDRHMANRVEALRADIRQHLLFRLLLETPLLMYTDGCEAAISRIREVVELAPEEGLFHFMLSGTLMSAERFREALEAVNCGLQTTSVEGRELLEPLKGQIQQRYCAQKMEPARALFKQGEYRKARSFLRGLNSEYRNLPLYTTFDDYLSRLAGGMLGWLRQRDIGSVQPPGSFADADALYFFLVGEEIHQAKRLLGEDNTIQALKVIRQVVGYCPLFPYANYHLGGCLFRWLGERMESNDKPELTEFIDTLERARSSLKLAVTDPEIAETALDLLKRVEGSLEGARKVQQEVARRQEEAKYINLVIEEFNDIMKSAESGIRSAGHYQEVSSRMRALKTKLSKVAKQVQGPDGRDVLAKLTSSVDGNLEQLRSIEADIRESEVVQSRIQQFSNIMDSIPENIITSRQQLYSLLQSFGALKREVEADLGRLRSAEARNTLNQILEAINRHLSQLSK